MSKKQQQLDLRPFKLLVLVPPMLAEAIGYTGKVFGHPLNARYVGFYWERAGDEANWDDGRASGTGEYSGFLAFVDHPRVAVHLQYCDFGSSEKLPRHILLLDRGENQLYALPVQLAQQFLHLQWLAEGKVSEDQPEEAGGSVQAASLDELASALNLDSWREVTPSDDFNAQVTAAMQRQGQLLADLVGWLDGQQKQVTDERIAEYETHAPAMLLRHVVGTGAGAFARAGEMVHIHEVVKEGDRVSITFYRDNGIDGPDESHLFSVSGSWAMVLDYLEVLIEPGDLDDLLASGAPLEPVFGRYAAWNGQAFPVVPMLDTLAIRVSLPCARCGRNPMTVFARSGLHRGAFCYVYDALGNSIANLRDQEYVCRRCEKARSEDGTSVAEDGQQDVR